jgi:predicted DNA-binding protein
MERINLNIPEDARKRLKTVARRTGRTESETARALLLDALDRAEREDFYAEVAEAQTMEIRERQIDMIAAYEKLRG